MFLIYLKLALQYNCAALDSYFLILLNRTDVKTSNDMKICICEWASVPNFFAFETQMTGNMLCGSRWAVCFRNGTCSGVAGIACMLDQINNGLWWWVTSKLELLFNWWLHSGFLLAWSLSYFCFTSFPSMWWLPSNELTIIHFLEHCYLLLTHFSAFNKLIYWISELKYL